MKTPRDLTGQKFGRLTVLRQAPDKIKPSGAHSKMWECKCDCGNIKIISRSSLVSGDTVSCGCYHKEHTHDYGKKHGLTNTKLYTKWSGIVQRCTNPNAIHYDMYGGHGITICDEWRNDFYSFYSWSIENGYKDGLTIDRIDNNKGYYPENCRWTDLETQANNTRRNHYITYNNETKTLTQWARLLNVNVETLRYRVNHGNMKDFLELTQRGYKPNED